MSIRKAKDYYAGRTGPKRLNCGQAVIAAFRENFGIDENAVHMFASFGSGRAPGGECGALYAAKFLLNENHKEKIEECTNAFISKAGSIKCKEIRHMKKLPCVGCVETAAKFLEDAAGNKTCTHSVTDAISTGAANEPISLERQVRIIAGSLVLSGTLLAIFINPWFLSVPLFVSSGLIYAGVTDSCMMGTLLMKLPYNKNPY
ncbi:MAG: C-GCAxxG-C-C family (seleno)protein [Candidatus Omnitrophota bacterium]|nr:C-GCAxxG-C-C family (seleno)protein [Candidatus Omnitrophota bacterium]